MLSKATIEKISKLLKVKAEDLTTAIAAEAETDVPISDDISLFTPDEVKRLKSNSYNEGKEAQSEMIVKEYKEKLGLSFTGKTMDALMEAHAEHITAKAGAAPDEKVKELNAKIDALTKVNSDYESKVKGLESKMAESAIEMDVFASFTLPTGEDAPAYSQKEIKTLAEVNGYSFKKNASGQTVVYKGDELQATKTGDPKPLGEFFNEFMVSKRIITQDPAGAGGRARGNSSGGGAIKTLSQLKAKFENEGKSLNGEEFNAAYTEAMKDPNFDTNS